VQAYLDLIEMQLDNILPDEVMYSDYMQELYRLAARVFAWCNDFYSLLKDVGREPLNLVLVLQHKYDLSLEDANAQALIIHDNDVACIV
ncbi:terpene synthase family protein, partial [Pseudoxanthomonas sp. KAs_5_3]